MKLLLSCVNSLVSLIGYDTEKRESFWYCPADRVRACGACYAETAPGALIIATDSGVTRYSAAGRAEFVALPGPHDNLAHSVHVVDGQVGVADTGNSRVLLYSPDFAAHISFDPLEGWGEIPRDAIHLNDFARTPGGFVASCFNYRPYRTVETPGHHWQSGGYGLLLSLEKHQGRNVGRVLAPGLSCPHSLVWSRDRLYCCASATGEFLRFAYNDRGLLVEEKRWFVSGDYFIRGALPLEDGSWLLGGSTVRRSQSKGMAVLRLEPDGTTTALPVAPAGEIYDILPWDDAVMRPVAALMNSLPPAHGTEGNNYPPPCALPW